MTRLRLIALSSAFVTAVGLAAPIVIIIAGISVIGIPIALLLWISPAITYYVGLAALAQAVIMRVWPGQPTLFPAFVFSIGLCGVLPAQIINLRAGMLVHPPNILLPMLVDPGFDGEPRGGIEFVQSRPETN